MLQLNEYKIGDDIMAILETSIYNSYNGRVDFQAPQPGRGLTVETGLGGHGILSKAISERAIKSGLVISASTPASIVLTQYTIPFLANIDIKLLPALDNIYAGSKMLDGYVDTSYTYRILDKEELITEIVCVGKLPVFEEELLTLIRESCIHKKYEMYPYVLKKYIMNCLKNLE